MREIITLVCSVCKRKNYASTRNKKPGSEKITIKKYCYACRKRTPHKEEK
ncbi:MAG: 50S ribosomal protein L33 [Candidatus Margulisiibacteriota bacterium]